MSAPFISWIGHGAVSLSPAGVFTGVTAHAFGFAARRDAMQALVDKFLNAATGGKVKYEVIAGQALVTFIDVQRCTSSVDTIGWVPGRESALWVPLLEWTGLLPRLVLWSPYIYINYDIGMATGREVWGWSKVRGQIDVAGAGSGDFTCSTTMFHPMGADTPGTFGPLFKVAGPAQPAVTAQVASAGDAFAQVLAHLFDGSVHGLGKLGFDMKASAVALKQFRDSLDPTQACYQAVCDSPVEVTKFGHLSFLDASDYSLQITTADSHRIAQDFLGVTPSGPVTSLPIEWAVRTDGVDFEALPGRVIAP